jgi:hypothetical protein
MQNKLTALFMTGSGWAFILIFIIGGLGALESHGVVNVSGLIALLGVIGGFLHPTEMVEGRSVGR